MYRAHTRGHKRFLIIRLRGGVPLNCDDRRLLPALRVTTFPPLPVPRERVGVRVISNVERLGCSKSPSS